MITSFTLQAEVARLSRHSFSGTFILDDHMPLSLRGTRQLWEGDKMVLAVSGEQGHLVYKTAEGRPRENRSTVRRGCGGTNRQRVFAGGVKKFRGKPLFKPLLLRLVPQPWGEEQGF